MKGYFFFHVDLENRRYQDIFKINDMSTNIMSIDQE